MTRYAVYFAPPPDSPLHAFGSAWLGRDAWTGMGVEQPAPPGVSAERLAEITAEPRRYGFHATLKPPFALAAGRAAGELEVACDAFAGEFAPFTIAALQIGEIDGFLALVPAAPSAELDALAERAVRAFDVFRAPAPAADRARRAQAPLDARERELLAVWGYPYVLERWRFHLTLTQRLGPLERAQVHAALEPLVAPLRAAPLSIDGVALFIEASIGAPFRVQKRFAFRPG